MEALEGQGLTESPFAFHLEKHCRMYTFELNKAFPSEENSQQLALGEHRHVSEFVQNLHEFGENQYLKRRPRENCNVFPQYIR